MNPTLKEKISKKKVTINYDDSNETDIFDYFETDDPYKNIQIT